MSIALLVLWYFIFKIFNFERVQAKLKPLQIGSDLTIKEMLDRVLRLPAVGSKRYLTNKVRNLMVSRVLSWFLSSAPLWLKKGNTPDLFNYMYVAIWVSITLTELIDVEYSSPYSTLRKTWPSGHCFCVGQKAYYLRGFPVLQVLQCPADIVDARSFQAFAAMLDWLTHLVSISWSNKTHWTNFFDL